MSRYSDLLSGNTKTWPYGTTLLVEIVEHEIPKHKNTFPIVVAADLKTKEGFILLGDKGADDSKIGDKGTITFTKGGPLGGYWKFTKA